MVVKNPIAGVAHSIWPILRHHGCQLGFIQLFREDSLNVHTVHSQHGFGLVVYSRPDRCKVLRMSRLFGWLGIGLHGEIILYRWGRCCPPEQTGHRCHRSKDQAEAGGKSSPSFPTECLPSPSQGIHALDQIIIDHSNRIDQVIFSHKSKPSF